MSASRFTRGQKATALVPLALLSAAWTASLAGAGTPTAQGDGTTLPGGTSVPTQAIEAPASLTRPGVIAPAVANGSAGQVISTASTNAIPSAGLEAYQRAETVINAADPGCRIPWELIAAVGRVESDHGRLGGNTLNDDGIAVPGIYGIALDGTHGTSVIRDTDAGQYDDDLVFDRAVGPMQFIPSTWTVVGVDADGDAQRNPQDIDDASLASAVYLCSGADRLDTDAGRRASVYRYNHSQAYVDLVLSIMDAYLVGDYTAVPNATTSSSYFPQDTAAPQTGQRGDPTKGNPGQHATHPQANTGGDAPPADPAGPGQPTNPPAPDPTGPPVTNPPDQVPSDPVGTPTDPVDPVLTRAQAVTQCTLDGESAVLDPAGWDACIYDYTH